MADIVQSLFGVTPELYQQAQAQRASEAALQYAKLDPFQQANFAIGRGAYQLAGALGGTDPQLQMISTRNSIARQINYNDPNSIMQGVQMLSQAGDTVGAMQLADVARKMESEIAQRQQRQASAQSSLAQAKKTQAELDEIARQQAAFERLYPTASAATPAATPAAPAISPAVPVTPVAAAPSRTFQLIQNTRSGENIVVPPAVTTTDEVPVPYVAPPNMVFENVFAGTKDGVPIVHRVGVAGVGPQSNLVSTSLPPVGAAPMPAPAAAPAPVPAVAPAAPVIPTRQATGTKVETQIQDLEKKREALLMLPKVPQAVAQAKTLEEQIKFLRESTKQRNFTGDAANAARYLYGTTDSEEIYRNYGPQGLAAVQEREKQIVQEKRPVTNITNPVTVNMQKGFGENLTDTITGSFAAARSAASTLGTVENMSTLLDEGVRTGFGQETLLKIGQAGQLFDPNFNIRGLAGQEAFQALATQIVLPQVKQLGASPTDTDLKFIVTGSPALSKTVEGNKLLLDTLKLKLQREIDYGKFSTRWMATNSSLIKTDPITARSRLETDFETYTQSSPLYGPAANTLRERFTALGGQTRGSEPARRAAQAGGLTR